MSVYIMVGCLFQKEQLGTVAQVRSCNHLEET